MQKFCLFAVLVMVFSATSNAYDRGCFRSQSQCVRSMTASLSRSSGVQWNQACEDRTGNDDARFSFLYRGREHSGYFADYRECYRALRMQLMSSVNDLVVYSGCISCAGTERTGTGGTTPEGEFCFEYRYAD